MALCELQKLFKKDLHKTKTEAKLAEIRSKFNLPKGIDLEEESQDMEGSSEEEVEMSDLTESGMVRYQSLGDFVLVLNEQDK